MTIAKCSRCGGKAQGESFEEASSKINHAVGLSRGIKCGDNYNMVSEIKDSTQEKPAPKVEKPKESTTKSKESTSTESKVSPVTETVEQKSKSKK